MNRFARSRTNFTQAGLAIAVIAAGAAATPAHAGLSFNFTFDPGLASEFGTNASVLESDVIAVGNTFSSMFTNNVQLNIDVVGNTASGVLAESLGSYNRAYSYAAVRTALVTNASMPVSIAATAALPVAEPTPNKAAAGTSLTMAIATAEQKALHLLSGTAGGSDGTFYIGTNNTWNYGSVAVSGAYSFINAAEHEISEIMGRSTQLTNASFNFNTPIDLFRCTATGANGQGVINMSPTATGVYFSTDGCATVAKAYNGPNSQGADLQDWASSATADPYDAFQSPGVVAPLSLADQEIMNVLGWQSAIPEPMTVLVLLPGVVGMGIMRNRRTAGMKVA